MHTFLPYCHTNASRLPVRKFGKIQIISVFFQIFINPLVNYIRGIFFLFFPNVEDKMYIKANIIFKILLICHFYCYLPWGMWNNHITSSSSPESSHSSPGWWWGSVKRITMHYLKQSNVLYFINSKHYYAEFINFQTKLDFNIF